MKVVELGSYGATDQLQIAERPEPAATPGRVLVRVAAAPVNPVDLAIRAGALAGLLGDVSFPLELGWEFAGRVLADEGSFTAGQRVAGVLPWFATRSGTYAEVISVDPSWLAPIPDGIDDVTASAVPLNALTARQALDALALSPGATLLVTGASGAVGGYAVQLATAAGLHVMAVASTDDEAYVAALGAKEVFGRPESAAELARAALEVAPDGVDAVFDPAGLGGALIGAVRAGGGFATPVARAVPTAERDIRVVNVRVSPEAGQIGELLQAAAAGTISPRIAGTLPLAEAAIAHARAGATRGKLVLI
jgi:NADPH2:quinone reductase